MYRSEVFPAAYSSCVHQSIDGGLLWKVESAVMMLRGVTSMLFGESCCAQG